ncbi:MAG: hypothetical protein JSV65_13005, partial [Armatimonadota bacterium]
MCAEQSHSRKAGGRTPNSRAKLEEVPDGLWVKCSKCGAMLYRKELVKDLLVCKRCA